MPLYGYACAQCGPFEARGEVSAASAAVACAACGALAARTFSAPGGRGPRRQRQLQGLDGPALKRIDHAQEGGATVGAMPAGSRVDRSGRPKHAHSHGSQRPWQLGH
jgi:putative FmdB family regulatory protein